MARKKSKANYFKDSLVFQFLDSQAKTFTSVRELNLSDQKLGDFNVFQQFLDYTPDDILKLTLEIINSEFPESKLTWLRFTDESSNYKLKDLLKLLDDIDPLYHLDKIYDENRNWDQLGKVRTSFHT